MRFATTIGGIIGIAGIIVAVILFVLGQCEDYSVGYSKLAQTSQQEENELKRLQNQKAELEKAIVRYRRVLDVNAQYVDYIGVHEAMENVASMAERALTLAVSQRNVQRMQIDFELGRGSGL